MMAPYFTQVRSRTARNFKLIGYNTRVKQPSSGGKSVSKRINECRR